MADLNKGKFQGLDENAKNNYADSFVGATKVAEKVKKGGSETASDGYVVDAIDIDWGGLKLTTISDNWSFGMQEVASTEQNAGKGDNTKGIHSTAYLLNLISSSFTQIYNQIGKDDTAADSLRKRIKVVEDDIHKMAELTPGDLDEILKRIKQIEDELSDPGATTAVLSILDSLVGFDKTNGSVKDYIDKHDQTILGTATDEATANTIWGAKNYAKNLASSSYTDAVNYTNKAIGTAESTLLGKSGDLWPTQHTVYGVAKYADTTVKNSLIGASTDEATADTIWGAKNYADEMRTASYTAVSDLEERLIGAYTDEATADTIWGAKNYAEEYANDQISGTKYNQLTAHVIEESGEGILEFFTSSSYLGQNI